MNPTRRWSALLAICALAAGLFALRRPPAADTGPTAAPPTLPAQSNASMPARAPAPTQAPALPAADEPPLAVQVERLLATRKPEDAYRAYWLLADCATFNDHHDRVVFDPDELAQPRNPLGGLHGMRDDEKRHDAKLCGGMSERERQSRHEYLGIAARAGVTAAALVFANEGPFGDPSALQTRPDDALVKEWKSTAKALLSQAAENADLAVLDYLRINYAGGSEVIDPDPGLAFRYGMAASMIYAEMLGRDDMLAKVIAQQAMRAVETANGYTPAQRESDLAAARRIAELAKARREQARRQAASRN